jgi:RhtB (resistance to homoserine/threonine) family protein
MPIGPHDLTGYLIELAGLMAVFAFMIVSPGADTAMVLRQSLVHGRRAGMATSFGIGASLLFHVGYTILGLGVIVSQSLLLFSLLKWAGAAYLVYIGIKTFNAPAMALPEAALDRTPMSKRKAFLLGFATNALNPKPVLFFLSLFSALVSHETPALIKVGYGVVMASCLIGWFAALSYFLNVPSVRAQFSRMGRWLNRVTGAIFIGLGLKLAAAQAK